MDDLPDDTSIEESDPFYILDTIQEMAEIICEEVNQTEDHAVFILGVKEVFEGEDENPSLITNFSMNGYISLIAEAFYMELHELIEADNMHLFSALRDVIHELEQELGMDPDDEIPDDPTPTLH